MTRDMNGEPVNTYADSTRWASRMDQTLARVVDSYGSYSTATRIYRVRWYAALAATASNLVTVVDGAASFSADNVVEVESTRESERRRKYIDIECTAEVA